MGLPPSAVRSFLGAKSSRQTKGYAGKGDATSPLRKILSHRWLLRFGLPSAEERLQHRHVSVANVNTVIAVPPRNTLSAADRCCGVIPVVIVRFVVGLIVVWPIVVAMVVVRLAIANVRWAPAISRPPISATISATVKSATEMPAPKVPIIDAETDSAAVRPRQ